MTKPREQDAPHETRHVLVTGATGYIGGRLVPRLLARGHRVRVLVRDPERVRHRPWCGDVEVVRGDLLEPETLPPALEGIDTAYYLVHSMYSGADFSQLDRQAAENFVAALDEIRGDAGSADPNASRVDANTRTIQVLYLGGIVPDVPEEERSEHLGSRAEVGEILRRGAHTTEFRAGPIIGSGSASFEMVRYLTERLPVMIAPKWVLNQVRPIAIRDILAYLLDALGRPDTEGVIDVGADPLSFREMMYRYGAVRGLERTVIPVPVLAPALAARWVGLVTPVPNALAVPLVRGVVHSVVGDVSRSRALFPSIEPIAYRRAVELALERIEQGQVETRWSGASLGGGDVQGMPDSDVEVRDWEGVIREVRTRTVKATPEQLYRTVTSLGGVRGWLVWNWAWELRGLVDRIVGGPGLRRGRRHPTELLPGESVDFWRVEEVDAPRLLRLRAEMKVPGQAWLQWEMLPEPSSDGSPTELEAKAPLTRLVQTASFVPRGSFGAVYWYSLYPIHRLIFSQMADAIAADGEQERMREEIAPNGRAAIPV
ncbi:MAG: DUF2867 domain-containing protein [Candidatus Eisenbacteria bacterium]|uniref:DUF2867 domain-containing protein n=1 Tax=Eiseniibacteriota bacterium TaxID=2212470 RepID=A0A956SD13_UNCEI|nr:DUF2867 domain-containing protein [Candidatus Eisenbacteria bacterium]